MSNAPLNSLIQQAGYLGMCGSQELVHLHCWRPVNAVSVFAASMIIL